MTERAERYLAFVDYLGTRELYRDANKNAALLEDRRQEVEHAIQTKLQSAIADRKIEIGVFSDTVLIAGVDLRDVLSACASLLVFSLRKSIERGDPNDLRLLRGGVSRGPELRSGHLRPGPGVSVIPFFDGGLAFAFALEDVRRGSRIYVSSGLAAGKLDGLSQFMFEWTNMTGHGRATADVHEFLWPAYALSNEPARLADLIQDAMALWRSAVMATHIDPAAYRETLYHFDETLKCLIRSTLAFADSPYLPLLAQSLASLLPRAHDTMEDCNIRFVWGIWFQVLFVLARLNLISEHKEAVAFTLSELRRREYLDKFIAETDYDDYAILRSIVRPPRGQA